jgi:chemotaxis protein CheC
MTSLGELEQDALTEIFNIGVGLAADALYQIGREHVPLSVPVVELTNQQQARQQFMQREQRPLYAIAQTYRGDFSTDAILLFPQDHSATLVRLMVGGDASATFEDDIALDAMAELGNIVLNAVISNLATTLDLPLEGSLPEVSLLSADRVFGQNTSLSGHANAEEAPVLALMVDFALSAEQVSGYLVFVLDKNSSEKLQVRLSNYVGAKPN